MPTISSVEKYKGSTIKIEFEDMETAFLNSDIVSLYNLKAGVSLPLSAWEKIVFDNDLRRARERALYLLDYKDYSYIGLYKKLEANYSSEICDAVMDRMVEIGAVNDRRYAEGLAQSYMENRKYGRYKAFQMMRQKGLTKKTIDEALEEYEETTDERLRELIENKYLRYLEDDDDGKGIRRVKNSLVRYGYSFDEVNRAVKEIMQELED